LAKAGLRLAPEYTPKNNKPELGET
jgi:hypothetical protein